MNLRRDDVVGVQKLQARDCSVVSFQYRQRCSRISEVVIINIMICKYKYKYKYITLSKGKRVLAN